MVLHAYLIRGALILGMWLQQVGPVPDTYVHMHQQLKSEWVNATAWPKHLLVEYKWVERHEVNAIPGLYVLISSCECLTSTLAA